MSSLVTAQRTAGPIFKVPAHAMAAALAEMFGWPPNAGGDIQNWTAAEEATDVAMGRVFEVLSETEQDELADRLDALLARTGALWSDDPSSPATLPHPVPGSVP